MPRQSTVTTDLAWMMEQRRVQLRMRWDDIARAADITPAFLRKIRNGEAGASALTKAKLEDVLQWEAGAIDGIQARSANDGDRPGPPERREQLGGSGPSATSRTLGGVLVERGLRQPNELVISDQIEVASDLVLTELLNGSPDVFDDEFIDRHLLLYSAMRREVFEQVRRRNEKPQGQ